MNCILFLEPRAYEGKEEKSYNLRRKTLLVEKVDFGKATHFQKAQVCYGCQYLGFIVFEMSC
ncbi:hypothetical protein DEO72_LG3g1964 [Vigna unguiculata]|uniref:Uncharacterized protein n=1 Tax=Vigna unguiculata TaxID=3917 RepID=A0A4D6LG00_VIGUN|nr:hypothetical protein DEO72_LG3g1964 [Vigna unguiculata]